MDDHGPFDQGLGTDGAAVPRADDDAPAIAPPVDAWKANLRQNRSTIREVQERTKTKGERQAGLKPSEAPNGVARREQQISIEEQTGQAFADPAERAARRHASPSHDDLSPPIGPDDDMDMGM
jgi:hypothetical protein